MLLVLRRKQNWVGEDVVDDMKWLGIVICCGIIFFCVGVFKYYVEKKYVNCC